MIAEYHGLNVG